MHLSDVPTWLLLTGGLALWLFLGAVFGSHGERIRNTIRAACTAVADALRTAATAVLSWARWCFTNIERFAQWLSGRLPTWEEPAAPSGTTPAAAPPVAPVNGTSELNPTIVAFATIALLFAIVLNGYLLYEITPDLFSFSPDDLRKGTGRFIAWLVPLTILAGEVVGGILVKSEQRRKQAGNTEASTLVPWVIFGFCYCVELAAGGRRALSFLESASPFADEATRITFDSVVTALLWVALAGGIPWVIFLISRYIEPALSTSDAARQFVRFFGQLLRFVATIVTVVIAGIIVSLALGIGGIVTGLVGCLAHVASGIVRFVVFAILFVVVILIVDASGMTVTWFRGWRRNTPPSVPPAATVALVLVSALLGTGCQRSPASAPRAERKFAMVSASDLKPAPKPEAFDRVATVNLPKHVGEQHKVVQVLEPKLHVCLADVTASVDTDLRRALLKRCAEFVSELSEAQGPEMSGMVVPIVDAAFTSKLPVERLDGVNVPVRCATNPPIPEFPSRSTVADAKMKSIRDAYARAERDCGVAVGRAYAMAKRTREEQRGEFISRVVRELGGRVYPRTDILGAIGYVDELVRTERARLGRGLTVRVSIISDLEDDANGCTLHRGKVTCPAAPMRAARTLLTDVNTRYQVHQIMQSTVASRRGAAYVHEKGLVEARQRAWRAFWVSIAPDHVEPFTFTAPVVRRVPTEPSADDTADAAEGGTSCPSIDLLRAKREAVTRQTLSHADWIAYGRALSNCGPRTKPWESVGLPGRDKFLDTYVIPFMNGDAGQGSLFQTQEPAAYARIVRAWGIEG